MKNKMKVGTIKRPTHREGKPVRPARYVSREPSDAMYLSAETRLAGRRTSRCIAPRMRAKACSGTVHPPRSLEPMRWEPQNVHLK